MSPSSKLDTGQGAVMLCGREDNRKPGGVAESNGCLMPNE